MKAAVLVSGALLAGCSSILGIGDLHPTAGDDGGATDGPAGADAPVDAVPLPIHAIVVGSDYTHPGHAADIDVRAGAVRKDIAPGLVGKDPIVRHYGHEVFLVNRFGQDQITVLDDASHAVIGTFTLPAASNIQDVAAAGIKLYVPALASSGVLVVDRDTKAVKTIALLASEDPDGHPDCVSAFYTGTRVYVACGILDASYVPRGVGKIVAIDPFNDTVVATIDLPFPNPLGQLEPTRPATPGAGALTIGTVPSFTDFSTGCLARIKLATPETADCLVTNQAMGGGANHAAADPTGTTLWIASTLYTPTTLEPYGRLVGFDLGAGTLAAPISEPGRPIVDLAACPDGYVVATERGQNESGARVYQGGGPGGPLLDVGDIPVQAGGVVCY